ncbi:MAG: hypothetical protein ACK5Y2_04745 [Bdellovibrionales bacterium]
MKTTFSILSIVSSLALAQDMTAMDQQCRVEAKELALKSYQSCVATARTARLEEIRKEYQEKLAALKKQYDGQIQELKRQSQLADANKKSVSAANAKAAALTEPSVTLKKALKSGGSRVVKGQAPTKSLKPSTIITEAELDQSAALASSEALVENKAAAASSAEPSATGSTNSELNLVTGENETLQVVDPSLPVQSQEGR